MFTELFGFDAQIAKLDREIMEKIQCSLAQIDSIKEYNQLKVLRSFMQNKVASHHLGMTTGYGYGDLGRDTLDRVFADAVGAEDALCRMQFMSGTHALSVSLFGLLRTGDTLLAVTGRPYDTLCDVIGLGSDRFGSLREFGIGYEELPFDDSEANLAAIAEKAKRAKVVYIQRSRGYTGRAALSCEQIGVLIAAAKKENRDVIAMVDNCYGEFTERMEPLQTGADLIVGSLIKNPGGAIAETGGYIAGRHDLVELAAHRLSTPGTGREIGCSPQGLRNLYLGLYLAPGITAEALKSSVYAAALFEQMGYTVSPHFSQPRYDIITTIDMKDEQGVSAFCRAIQSSSPIDSFAVPEAWDMPGYEDKVIMAAGTFTGGASIELSCDAPMRPPYTVFLQGGISLATSRYAFLKAASHLLGN